MTKNSKIMKVGIKYCGGCNPQFNRSNGVNDLISEYPEVIFEPASKDYFYELIIIVNGCTRSCASHDMLSGKEKIFIKSEQDFNNVREKINELMKI